MNKRKRMVGGDRGRNDQGKGSAIRSLAKRVGQGRESKMEASIVKRSRGRWPVTGWVAVACGKMTPLLLLDRRKGGLVVATFLLAPTANS